MNTFNLWVGWARVGWARMPSELQVSEGSVEVITAEWVVAEWVVAKWCMAVEKIWQRRWRQKQTVFYMYEELASEVGEGILW